MSNLLVWVSDAWAWANGLSAEVKAAIIGASATGIAALVGVIAVIKQVKSQGNQSRTAILESERRKIKADMYDDAVIVCRSLADAAIELSSKLRLMNMEIEIAARAEAVNMTYSLPSARFTTISSMYSTFSNAAIQFIFLVENRRIVDPRIIIFRTAMTALLHDSRIIMFSDFVLHVMPSLPTENPAGGLYPYTAPSIDSALIVGKHSKRLIGTLSDATAYTEDFLTAMQNALLGDLFGQHLEARQPIDPSKRAVTLESATELETWFQTNSAWGIEREAMMAKAHDKFKSSH